MSAYINELVQLANAVAENDIDWSELEDVIQVCQNAALYMRDCSDAVNYGAPHPGEFEIETDPAGEILPYVPMWQHELADSRAEFEQVFEPVFDLPF